MNRRDKLLWMKEILEHLEDCHHQWLLAGEDAGNYLADAMKRDLDEVRRLCDSLKSESVRRQRDCAVAAA